MDSCPPNNDSSASKDGQVASTEPPGTPDPATNTAVLADPDAQNEATAGETGLFDMSPEAAMDLLCKAVDTLAAITGDVPPTPPVNLGVKPSTDGDPLSPPETPANVTDMFSPGFKPMPIGSPESHHSENYSRDDLIVDAHATVIQQQAIARKFFSKKPPPVPLEEYLERLQRYCPMSTAVYMAAGMYILKLCVEDRIVPVTARTRHRLVLASLRVAMKTLEDLRYSQQRFAGVGGVSPRELKVLEISLCYLTEFELFVNERLLAQGMKALQQVNTQGQGMSRRLSGAFQMRIPTRNRAAT